MRRWSILVAACTHTFEVPHDTLPVLASYHDTRRVTVTDDTRVVELVPEDDPIVRLTIAPCARTDRGGCLDHADARLDSLALDGDRVRFREMGKHGEWATTDVASIRRIEVGAGSYRPASWRPTFGAGLGFGGPAVLGALSFQFAPLDALVLEGGFGSVDPHGFGAYAGARVRVLRANPRPFVGTWAGAYDEGGTSTAAGARGGVDIEIAGRRAVLTLELDAGHALSNPAFWGGLLVSKTWFLLPGGTVSYFF